MAHPLGGCRRGYGFGQGDFLGTRGARKSRSRGSVCTTISLFSPWSISLMRTAWRAGGNWRSKRASRPSGAALRRIPIAETHPNVLKARVAFAQALAGSGQPARGIRMAKAAIEDASALFGSSSPLVGLDLATLAEMQMRAGQWLAARQSMERSRSILDRAISVPIRRLTPPW